MCSCLLLDLPEALSRWILVEWLHITHVLRLDSAFSSTTRSCRRFATTDVLLPWTVTRMAQLDCMFIIDSVPYNAYEVVICAFQKLVGE
jgi:hypothetical protein